MINTFAHTLKESIINNYSHRNLSRSKQVSDRLGRTNNIWESKIAKKMNEGRPLLFGRLGGIEAHCMGIYEDFQNGISSPINYLQARIFYQRRISQLCNNAGVYPKSKQMFDFFCEEQFEALEMMDIFSVWAKPFVWIESQCLDRSDVLYVNGDASYPWLEPRDGSDDPGWGSALENKRILVVSPFIDSIRIQSKKLDKIFDGLAVPHMDFQFVRAPLTQGGVDDGGSYLKHVSYLKEEISKLDFDIALISAGAYSLPLAAHSKRIGKIGIHAGGALQLFFGITGRRYESYDQVKKYFNEHWKTPYEHERPKNWMSIEDGCYW